jgi:hypothetical protein
VPVLRRLDAVLPLRAADCERAQILFRSLESLFEPLGTCWVVAPDGEVDAVRAHVPAESYVVLRDSDVIPEIYRFRIAARVRARLRLVGPLLHGWYVQQLVKLAIANRVATPFYLTLDADVICVRPTRYEDLVVGGRALVQTSPPNHPEWNDDAERVLGLPRSGRQYGVTPAVLSVDAVHTLAAHLGGAGWRRFLLERLPWTEYALYHTFLEQTGLHDTYHVLAGHDVVYSNSVWMESEFDAWDPAATRSPFCVVQSATRIPPERVSAKLATAASSEPSRRPRSLASAE